ncbi:Periplasmic protease [Paenibacillus uliginis N3/975]|uniref:Periplasmic protease n=1 Tax=Paenibacillus uliginis N3/975 TaxID=1313296 RepID=A0A1X7HES7_9BACL|nr:Periplasmic protease [Paenibacillus uliginis N3/975]
MQANKTNGWAHDEIIHSLAKALNKHYVFPDIAKEMGKYLELKLTRNDYEAIKSPEAFCEQITIDLREISNDKHLKLRYTEQDRSMDQKMSERVQQDEYLLKAKIDNYGFHKVERRPGNIGYIDLRGFHDPEFAGETAANAMNLVANTDALIFDVRNNGGGSPFMVAFITSYLFNSEPFHLNSFYSRAKDDLSQSWTLPYVPGKRYGNKPVYVLTSHRTFSAAEEFTYNLKNLKRATVVGEVTAGGANPGFIHQLTMHFSIFIPNGRAINPITQTNWEGTGVIPDVKTTQNEAYETAYELALNYVINYYQDSKEYGFLAKEAENQLRQLKGNK